MTNAASDHVPRDPQQQDAEHSAKGGDKATEEQLVADNAVEEDTIKSLDPENGSS